MTYYTVSDRVHAYKDSWLDPGMQTAAREELSRYASMRRLSGALWARIPSCWRMLESLEVHVYVADR